MSAPKTTAPHPSPARALTRRDAIRTGAATAASWFAAPHIIPASALGRAQSVAPSARINLGLIGQGNIMGSHRGAFLNNPRVQILAICDVDKAKRESAKAQVDAKYSGCVAYHEYEAVLARPDIDAVVIGTPDHWHASIAIAAMLAGKDVYVEKPMCLTIAESKKVREVARRTGRVLQVGSQQRSDPAFRKAAEMVRNGWIGQIKEAYTSIGDFPPPELFEPQPVPEGFDYDRWLGAAPFEPYHPERVSGSYGGGWRRSWDYGSRKHGDWGAHHYDIVQWALGMDETGPVEFVPKGYGGEPNQYHKYASGTKVVRNHPDMKGHMIRFIGEKGEVLVSRGNKLDTEPRDLAKRPLSSSDVRLYASDNHHNNWLDCILTRGRPIADVAVGHRTCEICLLSGIVERINRPVKWDPVKEEIVGDPEAAKWMDRPRRAPYALPS
ncbi:MAG: Gfo/Idh/MocA family oxidoreductase [Verrucomicrobiae bacterium]|nr:Gfo/Idh/MocA family oxidoreductase [Verrucomicrobiae bacterium]